MLSVIAVYDGKEIKFMEKIQIDSPQKVMVTFLGEPGEAIEGGAFTFLNNPEEDIYSDNDLKVKY